MKNLNLCFTPKSDYGVRLAIALITFFFLNAIIGGKVQAQKPETDKLLKEANKLFEEAKYSEAYPMFTQLFSIRKGDPDITFKYGATLLYGSEKKAEAIPFLRKSSLKSNIDPRVFYFLGKAYHLNYEFDKALEAYEKFRQKGDAKQIESLRLSLSVQQCNNGKTLLSQIKDVLVLDRIDVSQSEFFRYYDLENLSGKILLAPEDFQSSIDKKNGHRPIIYSTPLSNIVYFSSYGKKGDKGTDIYYATRKGDGSWSEPILLSDPINTKFNEDFPFMHSDGKTLFFCSEGHNSMGGFDIFRSVFDESTATFSTPENLDFAINTPDHDLLYIADSLNHNAFFASARASKQGELSVYEVKVDLVPSSIILLKGQFISELDPSLKKARITVEDAQSKRQIGIYNTESDGGYIIDLKFGGAYNFYVEAGASGIIHTGKVEVPRLESIAAFRQELIMIDDNGVERLMIKNYFEEELDGTQELLALALKRRADLNVTPDDELEQQLQKQEESAANANFDNLYLATGMSQFHSNLDVPNWLDMKAMELSEANTEYTDLSAKAHSESMKYQASAEQKIQKAQAEFSAFETSENNEEKARLLRSFITLRNEAKVDLLNAGAAANIAKKLSDVLEEREKIAAEIQNEELLIRQALQDKDENAIESSMSKISALNAKLKGPKYHADPSVYLTDIKEIEGMKAMQSYDSAEDLRIEKNEQIELLQRLETQLSKAKDKDKVELENRIADVKSEIEKIEEAMPEKWENYSELDWNSKLAERSVEFANSWEYDGFEASGPDESEIVASETSIETAHESVKVMESKEEAALLSLGISYEALMKSQPNVSTDDLANDNADQSEESLEDDVEEVVALNTTEEVSIENELVSDFDKKREALNNNPNVVDQLEGKILLNAQLLREVNRNLESSNPAYDQEELTALKSKLELETVSMIDQFKKEIESRQDTDYSVSDFIPEYEEQKSNIESYSGSDLERDSRMSDFYAYSVDKLELILDSVNALPFPENDPYLMRQQLENQNALKIIITELKVKNYELKENVELLSTIADLPTEDEVIKSIDPDYVEKSNFIESSSEDLDVKAAKLIQLNESLIVGLNEKLASKTQEFENAGPDQQVLVQSELDLINQIKAEKEGEINQAVMDMASGEISADPLVEANEEKTNTLSDTEKAGLVNELMPEFTKEKEAIDFSEMNLEDKRVKTLTLYTLLAKSIDLRISELAVENTGELEDYQTLKSDVDKEIQSLDQAIAQDREAKEEQIVENSNPETQSSAWSKVISYNTASAAIQEYENTGKIVKDPGFDSESLKMQAEEYYPEIDEYNSIVQSIENLERNERNLSDKELKKSKKEKTKLNDELLVKESELLEKWIPLIHVSAENISQGDDYLDLSKSLLAESTELKDEEKSEKLKAAYLLSMMSLKEGYHQGLDEERVAGIPIAQKDGEGLDYNSLTIDEKKLVIERNIQKLKEGIIEAEQQKALNAGDVSKVEEWSIIAKTYQDALVWNQNELSELNVLQSEVKDVSDKYISMIKAPTGKDAFTMELENKGMSEEQSKIITSDPEIQTYYAMQYVENEVGDKINTLKRMRSAYREEGDQALSNYYDGSVITQGESALVINDFNENAKRYQEAVSWYQKTDSLDLLITSLEAKKENLKRDKELYFSNLEAVNKQTINDIKEGRTPVIAVLEEPEAIDEEVDPIIITEDDSEDDSANDEQTEEFTEEVIESDPVDVVEEDRVEETPVFGDPALSGFIFESGQVFYSEQEPIPVNPPLPEGLVFKIQIGAFRNALPPEHFVGLSPMMAEKLPNGITRYSVGIFRILDEARNAQAQVRSIGYSDAFIVAFYNGIRISLNEAKRLLDGEDVSNIASISNASDRGLNTNDQNNTNNAGTQSTSAESQTVDANAGPIAAQDVSDIPELFYTVQVGVYSKELKEGELRNINDLNVEKTGSGYFRYTSGRFDDVYDAGAHKQTIISKGINDAFVTAYSNGQRISVTRAQSLENTGQEEETITDPVVPVIIEQTDPEPEPEIIEVLQNEEELPDESELTFVVFIGSYSNSIPNNVASALLENAEVGIKRAVNGGKTIYSTKEIETYTEATIVLQHFQEKGVDQARMLYVLNGNEISQEEAFKILRQ